MKLYYPNKSKNIMQVRNSLHNNKKQKSAKHLKTDTKLFIKQQHNGFIKTVKDRTPSKSKSNSEKQNKYKKKQYNSRSKKKNSLIKNREIYGPNCSPISKERNCSTRRSPLKSNQKRNKKINSHRQYDKKWQTSTKLHSERTPAKKVAQKISRQNKKTTKKNQICFKSKKSKNNQPQIKKYKSQHNQQHNQQAQKKIQDGWARKKKIPEINTRVPQRKQSYFDQQTLQRFNLDNAEYMRRRKWIKLEQNEILQQKKYSNPNNLNVNTAQYRQYGTQTQNSQNAILSYRDLQSFRKQQELKWKIMYLELNQLKITTTPQKIQKIIQQSHRNISQFQVKCKQIVQSQIKNHYFIQSPTKIRSALRRQRKSSQENKSLIKTFSDKKLLQQLEILQQLSHIQQQRADKPSSSSFCLEFQKQLESYSQQNFLSNQNQHLRNIEIQHIPQLEFKKSNSVYLFIQQYLFEQFSLQLLQKQTILHSYLITCRKVAEQIQLKIKCNQIYSIDLIYRLFQFIQEKQYINRFLSKINTSLRDPPVKNLKLLRNYFNQNQEQAYEQQNNQLQPVLDSDLLNYFESEGYNSTIIQNQYFYNHAVYRCLNQIIDSLRPKSVPTLNSSSKQIPLNYHKSLCKIFDQIFRLFSQILKVRIGRQQFNEYQFDPIRVAEHSYVLLDKLLVKEEEQKWSNNQQKIIQQKYLLAQYIVNDIFNQEIMMIYNEFF